MSQEAEKGATASPTSSPPDAKRRKLMERDAKGYHSFDRNNEIVLKFLKYYTPLLGEEDIAKLGDILAIELPGTFRVCGMREDVMAFVDAQIAKLAEELNATLDDSGAKDPYLKRLAWYPGGMGWQVGTGRMELKKGENQVLTKLKQFLVSETTVGHISRQEAVSMIPPLFMDIKEWHRVLDMCAAPGSKTAQLIEAMHRDAHETYNPSSSASPSVDSHSYNHLVRGIVHANDASAKRCNTLITQTKRLDSPALFVTQHDAQILPTLSYSPLPYLAERNETLFKTQKSLSPFDFDLKSREMGIHQTSTTSGNAESTSATNGDSSSHNLADFNAVPFLYDRILCDVPCSGDGTFRKNPDMWLKWKPTSGHALHNVQLAILLRAVQLAAPGARIVYSTCSMNPVEDEAVILETMRRSPKKLRLVDVSGVLPELKFRPGVGSWSCSDDEGNLYSSFDQVPAELQKRLHESSFAPKDSEEAARAHIEYCMRFVPHDQNTGGFFVAVLELVDEIVTEAETTKSPAEPSTKAADASDADGQQEDSDENGEKMNTSGDVAATGEKRIRKQKYRKPQPTEFEKLDLPTVQTICPNLKSFFELSDDFPFDQLVKHSKGLHKLYLVSRANALLMDHDYLHRLKLKISGVRLFENMTNTQGSECEYRATQDGVASLFPFLGPARVVNLSTHDVNLLLTAKDPVFDDFEEASRSKLTQMTVGSVIFSYHVNLGPSLPPYHLLLVGWRGKVSSQILIKPSEMPAITSAFNARVIE